MTDRLMEWLIRYHDGSEFSNRDGEPWEAPRYGVMEVLYCDAGTGVSHEGSPAGYWVWRDGQWSGVDTQGWWDYLYHHPGPLTMIFGRTIKDAEWESRVSQLAKDRFHIEKSGWRKRERREQG